MTAFHRQSLAVSLDPLGAPQAAARAYTEAQFASEAHCERILAVFRRFEAKHGLLPGEGVVLLLNTGIRL